MPRRKPRPAPTPEPPPLSPYYLVTHRLVYGESSGYDLWTVEHDGTDLKRLLSATGRQEYATIAHGLLTYDQASATGSNIVRREVDDPVLTPLWVWSIPEHHAFWARPHPILSDHILCCVSPLTALQHDAAAYTTGIRLISPSGVTTIVDVADEPDTEWVAHPEWSPDGSKIVLMRRFGPERRTVIEIRNSDGGTTFLQFLAWSPVGGSPAVSDPSWSADGKSVYFVRRGTGIQRFDLEAHTYTLITNDNPMKYDPYESPDGRYLAWLQRDVMPTPERPAGEWSIRKIDLMTNEVSTVIADGNVNSLPTWVRRG